MKIVTVLLSLCFSMQTALAVDLQPLQLLQSLMLERVDGLTAFSPDEQQLVNATVDETGKIQLAAWSVTTAKRVWRSSFQAALQSSISQIRFTRSKIIQLVVSGKILLEFSAQTGQLLGIPKTAPETVQERLIRRLNLSVDTNARFRVDEGENLTAYTLTGQEILLNDSKTGRELGRLKELIGRVNELKISPDSRLLAARRYDGRISLWDIGARTKRFIFRGLSFQSEPTTGSLQWDAGSRSLISFDDKQVIVWNAETGTEISRFASPVIGVQNATFAPSGQTVAVGSGGAIKMLDTDKNAITTLIGFSVNHSAFVRDGSRLAVTSSDGRLRRYIRDAKSFRLGEEIDLGRNVISLTVLGEERVVLATQDEYHATSITVYNAINSSLNISPVPDGVNVEEMLPIRDSSRILMDTTIFNAEFNSFQALQTYDLPPELDLKVEMRDVSAGWLLDASSITTQ